VAGVFVVLRVLSTADTLHTPHRACHYYHLPHGFTHDTPRTFPTTTLPAFSRRACRSPRLDILGASGGGTKPLLWRNREAFSKQNCRFTKRPSTYLPYALAIHGMCARL